MKVGLSGPVSLAKPGNKTGAALWPDPFVVKFQLLVPVVNNTHEQCGIKIQLHWIPGTWQLPMTTQIDITQPLID